MPHIEQPLQLTILSIKVNKYKKFIFFSFVFKVMEYPQIHTQKFNLNQEKKTIFFATPPLLEEGGGGLLQPPSPLIPLDENFYHSFVALTLIGG